MPGSRPASNPISFHKHTNQYYVTRGGKKVYLGTDMEEALKKYHRLGLGFESVPQESASPVEITIKELANRFIAAQRANWRNPETTLKCYKHWLGRFLNVPFTTTLDFRSKTPTILQGDQMNNP